MSATSTPPASGGVEIARPHVASADASQRSRALRVGSASDALDAIAHGIEELRAVEAPLSRAELRRTWELLRGLMAFAGDALTERLRPGSIFPGLARRDAARLQTLAGEAVMLVDSLASQARTALPAEGA